jgi:hypothetical protein
VYEKGPLSAGLKFDGSLEAPASDYSRFVSIPEQTPEHTDHVNSSSPVESLPYSLLLPQVIFVCSALGKGPSMRIHKFQKETLESHGRTSWISISPARDPQV